MSTAHRRPLSAPELYARSQGAKCEGPQECHYCGSPCKQTFTHGEVILPHTGRPAGGGVRKRPGSPYVCVGCWMWRRKKVTATLLSGGYKDGQSPKAWGWLVSSSGCWAVSEGCHEKLYEHLLNPPPAFFLSLLSPPHPPDNQLACCLANETETEWGVTQPLKFTINNVPHGYTVYELEQAAVNGPQGTEPGVQALLRLLGPVPERLVGHVAADGRPPQPREGGRPPKSEETRLKELSRVVGQAKGPKKAA